MTTITLTDDIKLGKSNFVNIYELYEYIEEKYILPDLQFTSYDDMTETHKKEYDKSVKIDKSKLINI